jgi:competence ComEA-like helix-hairpin-helix protein
VVFALSVRALARGLVGDAWGDPIVVCPVVVDVNDATVAELSVLPGIGTVRAEAIVLERIRNGPFHAIEDLCRVDGLGPETCRGLRDFLRCQPRGGEPDRR